MSIPVYEYNSLASISRLLLALLNRIRIECNIVGNHESVHLIHASSEYLV